MAAIRQPVSDKKPYFGAETSDMLRLLAAVAPKEVTLLFQGESGTGKEVLARQAHGLSPRRNGPFVPINCAAIPEALFETELFGHEKGAFTGATRRAQGKVEMALKGTLFLDEVGELPLGLQAKLLRFLEGKQFMRVGGVQKLHADIRLMLATTRRLECEVREGRFRADLFYRIQGLRIEIPPLRERRGEIWPLAQRFVQHFTRTHAEPAPRFTRASRAALLAYPWRGNVRELRTVIETLVLLRGGRQVLPEHLPLDLGEATLRPSATPASPPLDADRGLLRELVSEIVARRVSSVLGDRDQAARSLGISVRTIQRYTSSGRVPREFP